MSNLSRCVLLLMLMGCAAERAPASRTSGNGNAGTGSASTAIAGNSGGAGSSGVLGGASGTHPDAGSTPAPCDAPGTTRLCCGTGVQTCKPDAEFPIWGPCLGGGGAEIVCDGCGANEFGPGCDAGLSPPDSGAPPGDAGTPPGKCSVGMECKPGSVRYCDIAGSEWTEAKCDTTGHWGACVATAIPAGADGKGCAQDDYAPEICCGPAAICCQDNPNGPYVDFGSGACAAVSCP